MRVAHVNADRGVRPGGRKGAVVHLAAMRAAFESLGAEVLPFDVADPQVLRRELEGRHAQAPIDLVYERYALGAYAAAEFARARSVPYVIEVNAPLAEEELRHRGDRLTAHDLQRECAQLESAARVLCVSNAVREYVLQRGARPERAAVQPNAVDPELFRPRRRGDPLRKSLVPTSSVVIGFHGRLRPWHGFERLVDAVVRLLKRDLPIHLLVMGEGDFAGALAGRVAPSRFTLLGWHAHAEAARVVACMDVLPLTYSPGEHCYFSPLKLFEAMACGVVPVVPDLGDLATDVRHEREGLVYAPTEAAALDRALERIVRDDELRSRLARAARARARRRTWTRVAQDLLELTGAGRGT